MSTEQKTDGRFEGDLRATLTYDATQKKPYRVIVDVWRYPSIVRRGEEPRPDWYVSRKSEFDVGGYAHERHFRHLHDAVDWTFFIRGRAEVRRLSKVVSAVDEARREVLL